MYNTSYHFNHFYVYSSVLNTFTMLYEPSWWHFWKLLIWVIFKYGAFNFGNYYIEKLWLTNTFKRLSYSFKRYSKQKNRNYRDIRVVTLGQIYIMYWGVETVGLTQTCAWILAPIFTFYMTLGKLHKQWHSLSPSKKWR